MSDSSASTCSLLRISRPRFWMYCFGPYLVGSIIGAQSPRELLDWRTLLFACFFLFPANLFIYGVNDIHDWETDRRNRKKEAYETFLPPAQHRALRRTILLWLLPFCLAALFFTNGRAIFALLGFLFFSHQYSAPPIRAKARPIVDSIFNVLYVFPAFFAYFLHGGHNIVLPYVLAAWCWTMAMHAYSAVPDISADREAGLQTVATKLGLRGTLWFCLALYLAAAMLSSGALSWLSPVLAAVYALMIFRSLRAGSQSGVLRIYRWFPLLNTSAGFCLFWRVAWSKWF